MPAKPSEILADFLAELPGAIAASKQLESDLAAVRVDRDALLIDRDRLKVENAALKTGTTPPVVPPVQTGTTVTAKPIVLPASASHLNLLAGQQVTIGAGKQLVNTLVATALGQKNGQILLNGGTLQNVAFADGGYLMEGKGDGSKLLDVSFGNVEEYGVFFTDATNLKIKGLYAKGTLKNQSQVRFGCDKLPNSSGTVEDVYLEAVGSGGSVCMRGTFAGTMTTGYIKGRTFGLHAQDNVDEGQADGQFIFAVNGMPQTAANQAECLAAVKATNGDAATKVAAALKVAKDANGRPLKGDVAATLALRKKRLARFSNATIIDFTFDSAPIRWGAGTRYDIHGGASIGDVIFDKPTSVYPLPELLLPGDIQRTAPDITFTGHDFQTSRTAAEVKSLADSLGVKLVKCMRKGVLL